MKKHIPNTITLMNLFCGCLSIVMAFENRLAVAGILIFIAAVFDFFDGLAARLLHVKSAIGKELDSLADVISFGLAPTIIALQMLRYQENTLGIWEGFYYVVFLMTLLSAVRLAKFNLDERQTENFIGMPTPINAMFWASIPCVQSFFSKFVIPQPFILLLAVIMAILLVVEIPMFSMKFKNLSWKDNKIRFLFIAFVLLSYLLIGLLAIPFVMLAYPIISLLMHGVKKIRKRE